MTLNDFKAWLKTPSHIRRILVEIDGVLLSGGGSSATYYFANGAYVDPASGTRYLPYIVGGVSFSESLSTTGELSLSYGDIELTNTDGINDSYLGHIWVRKPIRVYLGDPSWPKSEFKLLFNGLVADVVASNRNSLNIVIMDKLQALNTTINDKAFTNLDTTTPQLIPLTFGECFNVTPLLVNKTTLQYQVHDGQINDIIEVRDNGLPVEFTADLATGKFTLERAPFGQITCSVQGDAPGGAYTNSITDIIKNIVKNYGANKLADSDLDTTNLTNFAAANTDRPVGVYLTDRQTVLDICTQLASSANAKITFSIGPQDSDSSVGKLQLVKLKTYISATYSTPITAADIEENSISITEKVLPRAATKIGFCKNWTVQTSGLAAGLPTEHAGFFANEYVYTDDNTNTSVKINYQLSSEPAAEQTLLITKAGATAEATERKDLSITQRYVYTMTCYPYMFDIRLGDGVALTNRRFNLNNTVGTVISVSRDWLRGRIEIGVLV